MKTIKSTIKALFKSFGYGIEKLKDGQRDHDRSFGQNEDADIQVLLKSSGRPTIFDIEANIGQSIARFRAIFPHSEIYSFEPDHEAFGELQKNYFSEGMNSYNIAMGEKSGKAALYLNTSNEMNSLLKSQNPRFGTNSGSYEVQVSTVDDFCKDNKIEKIHLPKYRYPGF